MTNIEGEWQQQQYWEEQLDWWLDYSVVTTTATFSQQVTISLNNRSNRSFARAIQHSNLRISYNSRIHWRHRPHAQQDNSFAPLASYDKFFFWTKEAQHPEWASPRCNNKNWLQQVSARNSTSTSRRTTPSCTTLSTTASSIKKYATTSSIKRYGFSIVVCNIEMDEENNNHLWKTQQRTTCPTIPLTSSDWGWGHQQQEHNGDRSDCQPSNMRKSDNN